MIAPSNIAIIGCSGAIGGALVREAAAAYPQATVTGFSRSFCDFGELGIEGHSIDYGDESTLAHAADLAGEHGPIDLVIFACGILHTADFGPEKSLRDINAATFRAVFEANTFAPALVAKHFLPKLPRQSRGVFAALSARVGSISDNRLGGWYSYRASKAALNMIIKTAAIETARKFPHAIVAGLHPGTVDSPLSKPFQANVPASKLFTPAFSAQRLLAIVASLTPTDTGQCFAWDGQRIEP